MGARYSVLGVEEEVRIDVAVCIWFAYALVIMMALQFVIMGGLAVRWQCFGGKQFHEDAKASARKGPPASSSASNIELPSTASVSVA